MNIQKIVLLLFIGLITTHFVQAQCFDDGHSTNENDSWLSCQTSLNPNSSRGNTHWLQYDLGYVYELGTTKFWNYNVANLTGHGFKQVVIDYSLDGISWTGAGTFQLPKATGLIDYEGESGLDLSGITARYILITALSNWNGATCTGLSQVRFEVRAPSSACGDYMVTQNIRGNSIIEGIYYGNNPIESNGTIKDGRNVTFKSSQSITLKTGFTAEKGSQFLAKIESCNMLKNHKEIPTRSRQSIASFENNPIIADIKVYPNPALHLLNIDFGEVEITDLMIINISGHEILRRTKGQSLNQIDVSQLPAGMYFINALTIHQKLITKRFIKASL